MKTEVWIRDVITANIPIIAEQEQTCFDVEANVALEPGVGDAHEQGQRHDDGIQRLAPDAQEIERRFPSLGLSCQPSA